MTNPANFLGKIQGVPFVKSPFTSRDDLPDVPFVDDDEYTTHMRLEQDEEEKKKKPAPPEEPVPPEELVPEEPIPETGGELPPVTGGEMGVGEVPGEEAGIGMGMPGEEEPKTSSEIGRIYELKKIYSRLMSIESYISSSSDTSLLKLRSYVSKAIDLFETLASNLDSFMGELDNIIVMFYKFLELVYSLLKKHYEAKEKEDEEVGVLK